MLIRKNCLGSFVVVFLMLTAISRCAFSGETWRKTAIDSGWIGVPGRNLIVNPGFELGGDGWLYDFFSPKNPDYHVRVATSREARVISGKGVDNSRAMSLPPGPSLNSYCFPIVIGRKYTVSFSLRAEHDSAAIWAAVIDCGWSWYHLNVDSIPTDSWKRYSYSFTWEKPNKQKRGYLRFNADSKAGSVLIDNVHVEMGSGTEYTPPPLAIGISKEKSVFVRGKDNAVTSVNVAPSSAFNGTATVVVTAKDAWEREVWKREIRVNGKENVRREVRLPTERLGVYHVSLVAKRDDGTLLGTGMGRYAIIEPPQIVDPKRMFGVCYEVSKYPYWHVKQTSHYLSLLGARRCRYFLAAFHDSTELSKAHMEASLGQVEPLLEADIEPLPCVGIMSRSVRDKILDEDSPGPALFEEYGKRLGEVVEHLGDSIRQWEITNEPNLWRYGSGPRKGQKSMPADKYVKVLRSAYGAIKNVDSSIVVAAPALNGMDFDYTRAMLQGGAADYMDMFTYHSYRSHPDQNDTYGQLLQMRELLDKHGFDGPMVNGEQYFGCNLYWFRSNDEEKGRGYYLPHGQELRTAGRIVRNYIHHIAAGSPYCAFASMIMFFAPTPDNGVQLYDGFGAYNAATRFLANAGKGEQINAGSDMRVFLFPNAADGPLLTIHTHNPDFTGNMGMPGAYEVFDIMGNAVTAVARKNGIPIRTFPVYVRFPKGTAKQDVERAFRESTVRGAGSPASASVRITGDREITVTVVNRLHVPFDGAVSVIKLPDGWKTRKKRIRFKNVTAGQAFEVPFEMMSMPIKNFEQYTVAFLVTAGDSTTEARGKLTPIFAVEMKTPQVDGKVDDWKNAQWLSLGEERLSKNFNPKLTHDGVQDLSGRVAFGWSKQGFACVVEVTDDIHNPSEAYAQAWANDCVQIYFDQLNDAESGGGSDDIYCTISELDGKGYAYIDKGAAGRYIGEANQTRGIDADILVAVNRAETTTTYEVLFTPPSLPSVELAAGNCFGFSLLINDNDGNGRKVGLTLGPKGTEPYANPESFVDLLLQGD